MVEDFEIDFVNIDMEKAKKLPNFQLSGDPKNGISMKKTEELLESAGYKKLK